MKEAEFDKYFEIIQKLDNDCFFNLVKRDVYSAEYVIKDTPIYLVVEYPYSELLITWEIRFPAARITRRINGEKAFDMLPEDLREYAVFYMDIFSYSN